MHPVGSQVTVYDLLPNQATVVYWCSLTAFHLRLKEPITLPGGLALATDMYFGFDKMWNYLYYG